MEIKDRFIKYCLLFIEYAVFFFSPIGWLVIAVGIMVSFDWVTGVIAAYKSGERVISGGFFRTFIKFTMYAIGIISTRMLEIFLQGKIDIPFASLLAGFIFVIEYKSVMENISKATGIDVMQFIKDKIVSIKVDKKYIKKDEL